MMDYESWRGEIKRAAAPDPDFDRLLGRIRRRAAVRPRIRAAAGMLAVLLITAAVYLVQLGPPVGNGDLLMSYVYDNGEVDGPVLKCVFTK